MKKLFLSFTLFGLLLGVGPRPASGTARDLAVEIIDIKDLGLSERDESRSVIEVRWRVGTVQKEKIVSFNLVLSVTYANGTTINTNRRISADALSARVDVPSVKSIGAKPSAFIKKMEARVTAVFQEKLTSKTKLKETSQ